MNDFIKLEENLLEYNSVSKNSLRSKLENRYDEFENEEENPDGIENKLNDEFDKCLKLVELFGENVFIYDKNEEMISLNENFKAKSEYSLCINCMESNNNKKAMLFEECSAEALKNYLGENTQYKLIDNTQQKKAIDFEEFCTEELFEKNHPNAERDFKDTKKIPRCDIVVWKSLDKRASKIILLVQCKSGKDWKAGLPVNLRVWKENFINFACEPMSVYAITDLIDDNQTLIDRSKEKGLLLDRARIINLLATVETKEIQKIRKKIITLLTNEAV